MTPAQHPTANPTEPVVELRHVGKSYAGIRALEDISLRVMPGEVHALVGENGAGKSTLGKVIGGIVAPTDGQMLVDGIPVSLRSPRQALAAGFAVIQQEPALVGSLTVAQNVFLGDEHTRLGLLTPGDAARRYSRLCERVDLGVPGGADADTLTIADQQKVEILRALARDARLIVMDEPTSSLGREETDVLLDLVRRLRSDGRAIVYVSHFLDEIADLADRFTVLRNGRFVESLSSDEVSVPRLVQGMLGAAADLSMPEKTPAADDAPVMLSVRGLRRGAVQDVDLDVRAGEIVGLAGLVGSGRTEVARMIFGADRPEAGTIEVDGRALRQGSPRHAISRGVGLVPEDRAAEGLLLGLSQTLNVTLPHLASFTSGGAIRRRHEQERVTAQLQALNVQPAKPERDASTLSGGNQQKVLFAKWLIGGPRVLLLDEPTRGVDVGAKWAIYQLIASLAASGVAIVLISSEAEEVVGLAHRTLVMRRGRITAEFRDAEVSVETVMHAALGVQFENEGTTA